MGFSKTTFNHFPGFHKMWHYIYAIGENSNLVLFNFSRSVITTWLTQELVVWVHQCILYTVFIYLSIFIFIYSLLEDTVSSPVLIMKMLMNCKGYERSSRGLI
jgi:hypothetical protein